MLSEPESLVKPESSSLADRWILSRLAEAEEKVNASFRAYEFAAGAQTLYDFWLKELCDVYLVSFDRLLSAHNRHLCQVICANRRGFVAPRRG